MKPLHFLLLAVGLGLLFRFVPELDIGAARLFYRPGADFVFALRDWGPVAFLHRWVPYLAGLTAVGLALAGLVWLVPGLRRFRVRPMVIAYVAASLLIGPGLVTNGLLKEYSGRARPAQVTDFGGPRAFTAAFAPARECTTNCAFVSGHAAMGFYMVTFALLVTPATRRRAAVSGAVVLGALFGLARMAEGGHWLSDVVFSGVFNIAVAWALYYWMLVRRRPGAAPPAANT